MITVARRNYGRPRTCSAGGGGRSRILASTTDGMHARSCSPMRGNPSSRSVPRATESHPDSDCTRAPSVAISSTPWQSHGCELVLTVADSLLGRHVPRVLLELRRGAIEMHFLQAVAVARVILMRTRRARTDRSGSPQCRCWSIRTSRATCSSNRAVKPSS